MSVTTRRAGVLSVLLAASVALVPPTAAHADGIRAKQWALDAMHTQEAWQTTKGAGVTVAVLDTGVENDHPDLVGNVLTGKDMIGFEPCEGSGPGRGTAPPWPASSPVTDTAWATATVSWASPPRPGFSPSA